MLNDSRDRSPFLRSTWYVAGWAHELSARPSVGRTILGRPVLLFRAANAAIAAIGGSCPHRFAPLSLGRVENGLVRCGYHGLAFDDTGRCVHNPHGDGKITSALSLPRYPVEQRDGVLWIWMGPAATADAALIPRFDCLDPARNAVGHGYLFGDANYELMSDNILDLSHVEFLHPALGSDAISRAQVEVVRTGDRVVTARRMTGELLPPSLAQVYKTDGKRVDRTMQVEWQAPANLHLKVIVEPADGSKSWRTGSQSLHFFTPATERETHYFYAGSRDYDIADTALTDRFLSALGKAFSSEDKPMIEAQQAMIGTADIMTLRPALLPIDRASVLARRIVKQRIEAEYAPTPL